MNVLLGYDRIKNSIARKYRQYIFKHQCKINHNDFKLVGRVNTINTNIKLGHGVVIYPDVLFFGDGLIEIDDDVNIGPGTVFYASKSGGIRIGKHTRIAAQCYIIDMDHGIETGKLICEQENSVQRIVIEDDVWIGAGVKVLRGTIIEEGAVIGAGAVAKGFYRHDTINVGVPAKPIKSRN